jgi:hypothetical protein
LAFLVALAFFVVDFFLLAAVALVAFFFVRLGVFFVPSSLAGDMLQLLTRTVA